MKQLGVVYGAHPPRSRLIPLSRTANPREHFQLIDSFPILVPEGYEHRFQLRRFVRSNVLTFISEKCRDWNRNITDGHFRNPTHRLRAGQELVADIFKHAAGTIHHDDRIGFLEERHALLAGAQGLTLLWEQWGRSLPKGKYHSVDHESAVWHDDHHHPRQPRLVVLDDGFQFDLTFSEFRADERDYLVCFRASASAQ